MPNLGLLSPAQMRRFEPCDPSEHVVEIVSQSACELPDLLRFLGLAQRIRHREQLPRPFLHLVLEPLVQFAQGRLCCAELSRSLQHLVLKPPVQFAQVRLARG
jgi:hypothetical protein